MSGYRFSERINLDLILVPGEVTETVTVTGQTPLVETASNTLGRTFTRAQVQTLPINGRDPNYLLALIPGVNLRGVQSINGFNPASWMQSAVTFQLDGVDASSVDSAQIAQGRNARVNTEGIEEFRMYQNSFSDRH